MRYAKNKCVGHILEKKNKGALVMRIALCEKQVRRSYSGKEEYDINRVSRFESETIDVTFAVNSPQAPSRHMRAFA